MLVSVFCVFRHQSAIFREFIGNKDQVQHVMDLVGLKRPMFVINSLKMTPWYRNM